MTKSIENRIKDILIDFYECEISLQEATERIYKACKCKDKTVQEMTNDLVRVLQNTDDIHLICSVQTQISLGEYFVDKTIQK